jgi:hypothetical protein
VDFTVGYFNIPTSVETSTRTQTRTVTVFATSTNSDGANVVVLTVTETETVEAAATGGSSARECGAQQSSSSTGSELTVEECPADNTAVVAGSVGGVLGAALLASLGVIFMLWRRRKDAGNRPYVTMPGPSSDASKRKLS